MNWGTGILVYVMVWWLVLFTVLPWGVKRDEAPEPGMEPAAPVKPMMWRKAAITTVLAGLVWGVIYLGIEQGWVQFRPE